MILMFALIIKEALPTKDTSPSIAINQTQLKVQVLTIRNLNLLEKPIHLEIATSFLSVALITT